MYVYVRARKRANFIQFISITREKIATQHTYTIMYIHTHTRIRSTCARFDSPFPSPPSALESHYKHPVARLPPVNVHDGDHGHHHHAHGNVDRQPLQPGMRNRRCGIRDQRQRATDGKVEKAHDRALCAQLALDARKGERGKAVGWPNTRTTKKKRHTPPSLPCLLFCEELWPPMPVNCGPGHRTNDVKHAPGHAEEVDCRSKDADEERVTDQPGLDKVVGDGDEDDWAKGTKQIKSNQGDQCSILDVTTHPSPTC